LYDFLFVIYSPKNMLTKHLKFLLTLLRVNSKKHKTAGFTLIELLVALVIGSLIISSLLGLVVDILQADRDENAFNETQREMQIALNYIVRELREAVYVYDGNCLTIGQGTGPSSTTSATENYCPALTNHLPDFGKNTTPILAFWKPEEIKDNQMPDNCSTFPSTASYPNSSLQDCQDLLVKRRTYTLVVYLQSTDNTDKRWPGKSRIVRYELPKYTDSKKMLISQGYVDPYDLEERRTFQMWPINPNNGISLQPTNAGGRPKNNTDVLVDFVDSPDAKLTEDKIQPPACPSSATVAAPDYIRSPVAQNTNNSFYACVRRIIPIVKTGTDTSTSTNDLTNVNQDVIIYLRGNAFGKQGIQNERNFRPVLQTQVLVRGVIDKNPAQ
jgi:prepilin-type N-terminal cleavage/methylation domain-containing protein